MTRILPAFAVCVIALVLAAGIRPYQDARAASLVFQADMYPRNVVPPVNDPISYGFVRFFFNDARTEADYTVDVKGLSNSLVTGAELYSAQPGTRGTFLRKLSDGNFIVAAGKMSFTPADWQAMAAGEWFVQVNSTMNPDGAMRGQVVLPSSFFSTIPNQAPGQVSQPVLPPAPPLALVLPPAPPPVQEPPQVNAPSVVPLSQNETSFRMFEDCLASRSIRMRLQWAPLNQGPQFIDLSLANNGFEEGTYVGSQALAPNASSLLWDGLLPGEWHYLRVNTQLSDGSWQSSTTIAFQTRGDCR